jgi:hypothetical protein
MGLGIASVLVALCGMISWMTAPRPMPHGVAALSVLIALSNAVAFVMAVLVNWRC